MLFVYVRPGLAFSQLVSFIAAGCDEHDIIFVRYGRMYAVGTLNSLLYSTFLDQFLFVLYKIKDIAFFGDQAWLLVMWHRLFLTYLGDHVKGAGHILYSAILTNG